MNRQWLPWLNKFVEWSSQLETRLGLLASGAVAMPDYGGFTWHREDRQLMEWYFLQPVGNHPASHYAQYTLSPLGWEYVRCAGNFPDEPMFNDKDDDRR